MHHSMPKFRRSSFAAALIAAFAAPAPAQEANAPAPADEDQRPEIEVRGKRFEEPDTYKVERLSSPKFTESLIDTPQTVTVITKDLLVDQAATSVAQALRNTPGIALTLGENGATNSGDSFFLRGSDASSNIFIDGVRDLAPTARDVFNVEQVEVVKGPAGADIGRGATSGYVNLVSKLPRMDSFRQVDFLIGEEDSRRMTLDVNESFQGLSGSAVRLNLMGQEGGVVGRDGIERQAWGVAPSVAFGLEGATRFHLYSQHLRQNNIPDGGVSAFGVEDYVIPALESSTLPRRRPDQENFYGLDSDFEDIDSDIVTARFEHDLSKNLSLRNLSRYGKTDQQRVLSSVNGAPIVSDDPDGGGPMPAALREDPNTWTVNRSRQASFRENEVLTNQTNLTLRFDTGAFRHALSGGLEFAYESQFTPTLALASGQTQTPANLYRPNADDAAASLVRNGAFADGNTTTAAVYLFDSVDLSERWQLTTGVRFERFETETQSASLSTTAARPTLPPGTLIPAQLDAADNLFSWKIGALFKPRANGSVYLAYANSERPPGSDNFALSAVAPNASTGAVNINAAALDPQESTNIELGTKWEWFSDRLLATAALFSTETKNDLARTDPADPNIITQYGERTIEGVELGLVGQITQRWAVTAGIAKIETEVTEGQLNTVNGSDTQSGASIAFSPELTATLWTTYVLPFNVTVGGGMRYIDESVRQTNNNSGTPIAGTAGLFTAPDYAVLDAMIAYQPRPQLRLQLNATNVTDEFHVASLNNSGQRYSPGAPSTYLLSVNLAF